MQWLCSLVMSPWQPKFTNTVVYITRKHIPEKNRARIKPVPFHAGLRTQRQPQKHTPWAINKREKKNNLLYVHKNIKPGSVRQWKILKCRSVTHTEPHTMKTTILWMCSLDCLLILTTYFYLETFHASWERSRPLFPKLGRGVVTHQRNWKQGILP